MKLHHKDLKNEQFVRLNFVQCEGEGKTSGGRGAATRVGYIDRSARVGTPPVVL